MINVRREVCKRCTIGIQKNKLLILPKEFRKAFPEELTVGIYQHYREGGGILGIEFLESEDEDDRGTVKEFLSCSE